MWQANGNVGLPLKHDTYSLQNLDHIRLTLGHSITGFYQLNVGAEISLIDIPGIR